MSKKELKKLPYVDSLRGFAILGVIFFHCGQSDCGSYPFWLSMLVNSGQYGVQLFYCISAFTLFMSMDYRETTEKHPLINYFLRRFFRIAPLFYIAVIYYLWQFGFAARVWVPELKTVSLANIISTATFTNGFSPYWINSIVPGGWSIAVEMNFYLCLPFLFKFIKNFRQAAKFSLYALFASGVIIYILSRNPLIPETRLWQEFLFLFFPCQLPVFLLGGALFYLVNIKNFPGKGGLPFILLYLFAVLIIFSLGFILKNPLPYHFLFAIAFCGAGYLLDRKPLKIFVNRFSVYIGKISFSLYLTHFAALYFMAKSDLMNFSPSPILNLAIRYCFLLAISCIISSITYRLIEEPGRNLGRKIISIIEKTF